MHTLYLMNCSGLTDVSALAGCAKLHELDMRGCPEATDLSALSGIVDLQHGVHDY